MPRERVPESTDQPTLLEVRERIRAERSPDTRAEAVYMPGSPDRLMTAGEVAEMLAVPESWVREHTRSGQIPHLELGRYKRYRREAVLAWLETQEAGGAAWGRHRPAARDGLRSAKVA